MRKFTLLGVIVGLVALAVPAAASANFVNSGKDCNYAASQKVVVGTATAGDPAGPGVQADVYAGSGSTGNSTTTAAGACANVNGNGGFAEAGHDDGFGTYVVADGSDNNPAPADGYMGLSNYDDSATKPRTCSQAGGDATSTNGGGCFGLKPTGTTVDFNSLGLGAVPTPMCGDTSGADWNHTPRDGCFIP